MSRVLLFSLFLLLTPVFSSFSAELDRKLAAYIDQGSVLVADDSKILYSLQPNKLFVPASILKIATALAALHYLQADYHFKTEFYLNKHHDLTIRGYGDPQLVSEEIHSIANALSLQKKLPAAFRNIHLDTSAFNSNIRIPGVEKSLNPYDALNGALIVNFNTIYVAVDQNHRIHSAEQQTPLTAMARQLAKGLPPGKHRINISHKSQYILPHMGGLFKEFLQQFGFEVSGKIKEGPAYQQGYLIHTHSSRHDLIDTITNMMQYSNNFMANQLFLTIGMHTYGMPATRQKGVAAMNVFLTKKLNIPQNEQTIAEGSGISRKNRITAHTMLKLLKAFEPYQQTLPKHHGIHLKTGTLSGVYTMAGYLPHPKKNLYFVIMLNQKNNARDKILKILLNTRLDN
ncbi:MAG: D-alanyl-D-alanine carboxypeptidase [SAR324 cluster bacterium]|nr:D-alanyl-D-alanine carboxypeptidase [SAR324 cluster bacterium]